MGIWFLAHDSAIFCSIWSKFYIKVQEIDIGLEHVEMIWHNRAKIGPNMGVAPPQAPVGVRGQEPLKSSVTGPSLLGNCYLGIKFHTSLIV